MPKSITIQAGNRLIADFMGHTRGHNSFGPAKFIKGAPRRTEVGKKMAVRYHDDWAWLMPVFVKIGELGFDIETGYVAEQIKGKRQMKKRCHITNWNGDLDIYMIGEKLIEATYVAVVEFVQIYKTMKK